MRDTQGNPLAVGDTVRVVAYGEGATSLDCGRVGRVIGFARTRVRVEFWSPRKGDHVRNLGGHTLLLVAE